MAMLEPLPNSVSDIIMREGIRRLRNQHASPKQPDDEQSAISDFLDSWERKEVEMKNPLRVAFSFLILLFMLCGALWAHQTGEVRGRITAEKGEALPGVAVTARSPHLQGLRTAVSDRSGYFRLPLLPVGTYSLTFELPGF
jgi:hypothetical protein